MKFLLSKTPYFLYLAVGMIFFPGSGKDDKYITLWAAHTLEKYGDILNYNFEKFEQSSSLLHTIILAILRRFTQADLVLIGWVFSIFLGFLVMFYFDKILQKNSLPATKRTLLMVLLAISPSFLYWSFGGLETLLYTFLITVTIYARLCAMQKSELVLIFLLVLTRPEAFIVLLCAFSFIPFVKFINNYSLKDVCRFRYLVPILITLISFFMVTIFRFLYFGRFFPSPVSSKAGGRSKITLKLFEASKYYTSFLKVDALFFVISILVLFSIGIRLRNKNSTFFSSEITILIAGFVLAITGFSILSGGDWMGFARFTVPIFPLLLLLAVKFGYFEKINAKVLFLMQVVILSLAIPQSTGLTIFDFKKISAQHPELEGKHTFHELLSESLGDLNMSDNIISYLQKNNFNASSIMSGQAGCIFFKLGLKIQPQDSIQFIDRLGLSSSQLSECSFLQDKIVSRNLGMNVRYSMLFPLSKDILEFKNSKESMISFAYYPFEVNEIFSKCFIQKPKYIYDLGNQDHRLEQFGYRKIFRSQSVFVGLFGRHVDLEGYFLEKI